MRVLSNVFEGARVHKQMLCCCCVAVDCGSRPGIFPDAFRTTWSALGSTPAPLTKNER